jgi:DNA-binding MarR family transcriptional regulator
MTYDMGIIRPKLQPRSKEMEVASTGAGEGHPEGSGGSGHTPHLVGADDLEFVRQARRMRERFFGENLFADPAWDMLLDLYRAELAQHRICTTSLCLGSGTPVSTALRWLNALEKRGLVGRTRDPLDGRRYFVALTNKGLTAISGYFAAIRRYPI